MDNQNPLIFKRAHFSRKDEDPASEERDPIDALEVFDMIRDITDPEHPFSLERLKVVDLENIEVDDKNNKCIVRFNPTVPHCSLATLIGLCIQVKLERSLPKRFKIDISVIEGAHAQDEDVNKQISDKERISAAMENNSILQMVNGCLESS